MTRIPKSWGGNELSEERRAAEVERLLDLYSIQGLVGEPPEPQYSEIVERVAEICDVPMAAFSLVDIDRQWFKAGLGLGRTCQTPRRGSFCDHAIKQNDLFVVEDALLDTRFSHHPMVLSQPNIRFYAAQTLFGLSDNPIGTLCVLDRQPRQLTLDQQLELKSLAIELEETFSARALSPAKAGAHTLRNLFASVLCNCDWLRAELAPGDHLDAITDIADAVGAVRMLLEALGEAPETGEWSLDVEGETQEAEASA